MKLNSSVWRFQANSDADTRTGEIHSIKCDIKELKAMVTAITATNSQVTASKKEHELTVKEPIAETLVDSEVAALKKQVSKLQNQLTTKKPRVPDTSATGLKIEPVQHAQSEGRQQTFSDSDGNFCYRCSEIGHFSAKCRNPENQTKVIHKLIRSLRKAKQGEPTTPSTGNGLTKCAAKKSEVTTLKQDISEPTKPRADSCNPWHQCQFFPEVRQTVQRHSQSGHWSDFGHKSKSFCLLSKPAKP